MIKKGNWLKFGTNVIKVSWIKIYIISWFTAKLEPENILQKDVEKMDVDFVLAVAI